MDAAVTYTREPGVIARRIAGETILVPARRRASEMALFTLNEIGTFIWEQMDGRTSADRIVAAIVDRFEVESDRAAADLEAFLAELQRTGCLEEKTT